MFMCSSWCEQSIAAFIEWIKVVLMVLQSSCKIRGPPYGSNDTLGPLHTLDWESVTIALQALSLVERAEHVKFASNYAWRSHIVCECMMDVKSTWILAWHQMDHVSWSLGLFTKKNLLEIGLTQNWKTTAFQNAHKPLIYSILSCVKTHMNKILLK